MSSCGAAQKRKLHGGRGTSCGEQLDQLVLQEVKAQTEGVASLQDHQLQEVAKECAVRLGVTGFKCSPTWMRGWRQRCALRGDISTGRKKEAKSNGVSRSRQNGFTHTETPASHYLTILTTEDRRGVTTEEGDKKSWSAPVSKLPKEDDFYFDYTTPEHNYSILPSNRTTPTYLQSHMEELLEGVTGGVAFFESEGRVGLELTLGEELVGGGSGGMEASSLLAPGNMLSQHIFSLTDSLSGHTHEFPGQHTSSILEDEHLLSAFNHRSFTDPLPFLPPSMVCSNWSTPPNNFTAHLSADAQNSTASENRLPTAGHTASEPSHKRRDHPHHHTTVCRYGTRSSSSRASSTYSKTLSPDPPTPAGAPPSAGTSPGVSTSPPGGLLANRLSQPVFPDEPEIVFHEIQLGPLHTTQPPLSAL